MGGGESGGCVAQRVRALLRRVSRWFKSNPDAALTLSPEPENEMTDYAELIAKYGARNG